VVSAAAAPLSRFLLSIIGFCPRKLVLKVKGKIAPLAITLLLPEAVKYFQVLRESSSVGLDAEYAVYGDLPGSRSRYNLALPLFPVKEGYIIAPDKSGLGIDPDPEVVKRYRENAATIGSLRLRLRLNRTL
jgi:hypothetical protein